VSIYVKRPHNQHKRSCLYINCRNRFNIKFCCISFMLGPEHTYTYLQQNHHTTNSDNVNTKHHICTFSACWSICAASVVKISCVYAVCFVLDILAFTYKQVVLYWCAFFTCLLLATCCFPCAFIMLAVQICVGVVLYLYWLNVLNLWHGLHYNCSHNWPWYPSL